MRVACEREEGGKKGSDGRVRVRVRFSVRDCRLYGIGSYAVLTALHDVKEAPENVAVELLIRTAPACCDDDSQDAAKMVMDQHRCIARATHTKCP